MPDGSPSERVVAPPDGSARARAGSWVADDAPDRCGWNAETKGVKGEDGSYASESCTACAWHKKGDPSKDCKAFPRGSTGRGVAVA